MSKKLGKPGAKGYTTDKGKPSKRFYLGYDPKEAERRLNAIADFWEALTKEGLQEWNHWSFEVAQRIAKGKEVDVFPPGGADTWVVGENDPARMMPWLMPGDQQIIELLRRFPMVQWAVKSDTQERLTARAERLRHEADVITHRSNMTFHNALDEFSKWVPTQPRLVNPETKTIKPSGRRIQRYANIIKQHHADFPLSALTTLKIEQIQNHWEGRPIVERSGEIAAIETCKDVIKTLRRFLRWLPRHTSWKRPDDYEVMRSHVPETKSEIAAKGRQQVDTFKIADIEKLWKAARPKERLMMLLALNCGFGRAEAASLTVNEIQGNYIKRARRKTAVYGEWVLWDETKKAIEWYLKRRPQSDNLELLLSRTGRPLDEVTPAGNQRTDVSNAWYHLLDRVADVPRLPFNKLRKTSGNWVRKLAGGEVMKVFHSRGKPVKGDEHSERYSNKPFRKVFKAIRRIEQKLAFLKADWPDKVPNKSKATPHYSRVHDLHRQGYKIIRIAELTGLHRDTVRKLLKTPV